MPLAQHFFSFCLHSQRFRCRLWSVTLSLGTFVATKTVQVMILIGQSTEVLPRPPALGPKSTTLQEKVQKNIS